MDTTFATPSLDTGSSSPASSFKSRPALTFGQPILPRRQVSQHHVNHGNKDPTSKPIGEDYDESVDQVDYAIHGPPRSSKPVLSAKHKAVDRTIQEGEHGGHTYTEETDDMEHSFRRPKRQTTMATIGSESFTETMQWDGKAILALDGGGIRGYSALLIIRDIMREIKRQEMSYGSELREVEDPVDGPGTSSYHPLPPNPTIATDQEDPESLSNTEHHISESARWLPCHYFDYVAGTSTGGLIAIMLGRLRMNIDDCISDYETLGAKVFAHSRWAHLRSPLFWPRDKYNHRTLEDVVNQVVQDRVPKVPNFPISQNFGFDENRCRTVVVAYQQQIAKEAEKQGIEQPYLFRTYKNLHHSKTPKGRETDRNLGPAHDIPIWKVARATAAAPAYFKPIVIDDREYMDGGFGANNPCEEIYEEVQKMNNSSETCVKVLLSIGTGRDRGWRRFEGSGIRRYTNYLTVARKWASEPEEVHKRIDKRLSEAGVAYFRLSVEDGLGPMKLDEWHARGVVRTGIGSVINRVTSLLAAAPLKPARQTQPQNGHAEEGGIELATTSSPDSHGQNGHTAKGNNDPESDYDGTRGADCLPIPEWFQPKNKTLDSLRKHTAEYLGKTEVQDWIRDIAQILVEQRRLRAKKDPQRWEKACFGAWYQCQVQGCPRGEYEYALRKSLAKHLTEKHKILYRITTEEDRGKLEEALDDFKIVLH